MKLVVFLRSVWLWVCLSLLTIVGTLCLKILGHNFSLTYAGGIVGIIGVVLAGLFWKFGPVSGALPEVIVQPNGEQIVEVPGEEFHIHQWMSIVLTALGILIATFGEPLFDLIFGSLN